MPPTKTSLVLTAQLPCGCVLTGALPAAKPKNQESVTKHTQSLATWLEDRWGRHNCNLVSSSNPNGLAPRK